LVDLGLWWPDGYRTGKCLPDICWYFSWTRTVWGRLIMHVLCCTFACWYFYFCFCGCMNGFDLRMRWLWRLGNIQAQQTKSHVYLWKSRLICMPINPLNRAIWNLFCLQFISQIRFMLFVLDVGVCCDEDKQAPSSEDIEDACWQNRTNKPVAITE